MAASVKPNNLSSPEEPKVDCTVNDKGTLIDCGLGNPIQRDAEVSPTEVPH